MTRVTSLLFAAMLFTSASAFAADTPDPNATGAAALPSGSNDAATPPNGNSPNATAGKNNSDANAVATTPGEESKGKPKITPQ
jgi:hypothetical protein